MLRSLVAVAIILTTAASIDTAHAFSAARQTQQSAGGNQSVGQQMIDMNRDLGNNVTPWIAPPVNNDMDRAQQYENGSNYNNDNGN